MDDFRSLRWSICPKEMLAAALWRLMCSTTCHPGHGASESYENLKDHLVGPPVSWWRWSNLNSVNTVNGEDNESFFWLIGDLSQRTPLHHPMRLPTQAGNLIMQNWRQIIDGHWGPHGLISWWHRIVVISKWLRRRISCCLQVATRVLLISYSLLFASCALRPHEFQAKRHLSSVATCWWFV